jgi:hypothetical protein
MLHGSIKYSIFMSNKNTIHHWVNFLLHNSSTVRQVEDVKLLKEHGRVDFKSTAKSLQGLQDLKKFSFTNLIWALSNVEAVSKNLFCTLALKVICTAKTQNGIDRRNQVCIQLFWILRSHPLFFCLVHNSTTQFWLQSYVYVVRSIYRDSILSDSWWYSLSVGSRNVQYFNLQLITCLLDVTRVCEPKKNTFQHLS